MNTYGRWNKKDEERDYINETIKRILPEVESYGVLSASVITIYNDAITDAVRDGMCVYNIYESLVVWLESIALREVKFKMQRVSSVVKVNKDDGKTLNPELAFKELKVMAKEYAVSFDETELNMPGAMPGWSIYVAAPYATSDAIPRSPSPYIKRINQNRSHPQRGAGRVTACH